MKNTSGTQRRKKVIIIGGGISGMTAGIYAEQYGFQTEIYEKHHTPGGECTGWDRKGYHIDNCIHWLTEGNAPGSGMNQIWRTIGAVNDTTRMIQEAYFYSIEYEGKILHLYNDLERAQAEFLEVAPEDREEINRFFDHVKMAETMSVPTLKPMSDMNLFDLITLGKGMMAVGKVMKEYGRETVPELGKRFKSPIIREAVTRYMSNNFVAFYLLASYAFMSSGKGIIPEGGSKQMALRIAATYQAAGGKLYTSKEVAEVILQGKKAVGIRLADGTKIAADYVICAADLHVVFHRLLPEQYCESRLKLLYQSDDYRVNSAFQVAFGIMGEEETGVPSGSFLFPCEPIQAGTRTEYYMGLRTFDYDPAIYPRDKRVIQVHFLQDEKDFDWWKMLSEDKDAYGREKERLAAACEARILKRFPQLKDRLLCLDTLTPVTYEKFCGAYKGSYMSFFAQKGAKSVSMKNTVKGLDNVLLAGQWLSMSGGLPTAATNGKFAADKLKQLVQKRK